MSVDPAAEVQQQKSVEAEATEVEIEPLKTLATEVGFLKKFLYIHYTEF